MKISHTSHLPTYEEIKQLDFNQLRLLAKSLKGIGKYGHLKQHELIEKIKNHLYPKAHPTNLFQELSQLDFNQLRHRAKSLKGIGKYGNLNKHQLIEKIINHLNPKKVKSIIPPQFRDKPIPAPRKKVESIIPPPPQFRDKPIPAPRKKVESIIPPPPQFRDKPIPAPRKKVKSIIPPPPQFRDKPKPSGNKVKCMMEAYEKKIIPTPPKDKPQKPPGNKIKSMIDSYEKKIIPPPPKDKPQKPPGNKIKSMMEAYEKKIIPPPPKDKPQKPPSHKVKSMMEAYEKKIIPPPPKDKPQKPPGDKIKSMIDYYEKKLIPPPDELKTDINELAQALVGYTKSYEITIINNIDPLIQLQKTRIALKSHISKILKSMKGLKFVESLKVTLSKISDGEEIFNTVAFFSQPQTIINFLNIKESLEESKQQILNKISIWISEGSGWTVDSVDNHYLNVVKYSPLEGSSYIKMPKDLRNRSLINIKNNDNECFRWCHIRHLNPQETNPQRIKQVDKEYIKNLNYSGIEFPVTIKQYNKIEKQNNININVFGYDKNIIYPIYISKERNEDILNLLLLTKIAGKHYILIKDFNKFMHNITRHSGRKNFCMYCLQHFSSERILNDHKENCITINGTQAIEMPSKNILKFSGFQKKLPVPFVIYADFEAITEKIDSCQRNDNKSYTEAYQNHRDCGYGYKVVCCYDDKFTKKEVIYRGEKAVYRFMKAMLKEVKYCKNVIKTHFNKPLKMSKDDEEKFQKADRCHICEQKFSIISDCCNFCQLYCSELYKKIRKSCSTCNIKLDETDSCNICKNNFEISSYETIIYCEDCRDKLHNKPKKVRDHCHITGKYRGAAHDKCNLKYQITDKIPVIFHNLRGYDSHFIMQEIGEIIKKHTYKEIGKDGKEKVKQMNINVIPNNMEKYLAIMLGNHLIFIDSFQFMSSSLDKLVSNLPKESFKYTSKRFIGKKLDLMTRKGVYPYDYMDSFDKFNEQLPAKEDFFSILNNEHITDEDYNHALEVWKTFNIQNMGEYHDLYLTSDILLLADVFENFRKTCLEYYKLDPCHYFTSPGLSWDAMLKMTNIKLELITDVDMFLFIEKGMRGGISYIANRYGKANNKYMKEYDEKATSKYIMYLDANNLYGWAMSKYLPTGGFEWLYDLNINDITKYKEDSNKGLILEVDLEYPKELHDAHNDYPIAAEKIKVTRNMVSDYSRKIAEKYKISSGLVHKLIPSLRNKEKYVLHYRNLQLYLDLGLKLTKIHRALEFNQSPWLKQYIDLQYYKED